MLQAESLVPRQRELATALIALQWPLGPEREVYWQPSEGTAASSACQKSGCYTGGGKRLKQGPFHTAGMGLAKRCPEKICDRAGGMSWLEKPRPGGTHQSDACTVLRQVVPGTRRCRDVLAGWCVAEPGAGVD